MTEPIRILHCIPGTMECGGIENFIMNLYRNIDRTKIQFDFLLHGNGKNYYEEEIKKYGGKIYRIPFAKNYKNYYKQATDFFVENRGIYNTIHIHCIYAMSYFDAKIAKRNKIENIIIHSHTSNEEMLKRKMIHLLLKNKLSAIATRRIACSENAAKWMFPYKVVRNKHYEVIKNAIDLDKYKFNIETREKMRKELNIQDKLVIGHIGRLSKVKNHDFLLEILKEISNKKEEVRLLLVGDGECKEEIIEKAKKIQVIDKIIFLGNINNVNEILQAMDFFVFPSIHEGFPLSVIEAQATGLPCFVSDVVTKNIAVTDLVTFISLKNEPKEWSRKILSYEKNERLDRVDFIKNKKYDISDLVEQIEKIYMNKGKE